MEQSDRARVDRIERTLSTTAHELQMLKYDVESAVKAARSGMGEMVVFGVYVMLIVTNAVVWAAILAADKQ